MENASGPLNSAPHVPFQAPPLPPTLLLELEPGFRVFLRNLADRLLWRGLREVETTSAHAPFWPDVFVSERMPWWHLTNSMLLHILMVAAAWSLTRAQGLRPPPAPNPRFSRPDVIYFSPDQYLPPLNTFSRPPRVSQKGQPEYARQPIISLPPDADNRSQTIVAPFEIKLTHEVPLPNIVAWDKPVPVVPLTATAGSRSAIAVSSQPIAPPPVVNQAADRKVLSVDSTVVTPPPEVAMISRRRAVSAPQPAVVAPPPKVDISVRALGELNIGHRQVIGPAPRLPVSEERARPSIAQLTVGAAPVIPPPPPLKSSKAGGSSEELAAATRVVPPPPSIAGNGGISSFRRQLVALSLRPAVVPPLDVAGNRRGTFAAIPEGKSGASGTPDIVAYPQGTARIGQGNGDRGAAASGGEKLPPGLLVGPGPKSALSYRIAGNSLDGGVERSSNSFSAQPNSPDPALVADKDRLRVVVTPHGTLATITEPTPLEREVFGNRRLYSMVLNMPNLNSQGGSWVIRFAELQPSTMKASGDLIAPEATYKVDPGYPLQLMREKVQGTVALYAVIHRDGTVGDVRVLSSPDDRLDAYACRALASWHFRPALKSGNPVALEAVVMIPFHPSRGF